MFTPAILYVEDDPLSRVVMEALLVRGMGHQKVIIWEDSSDFVHKLASLPWQPDVIFLDIHVDPLDGFEMLTIIRQDETYNRISVVALTASVMNEEVKRLKEAGFNGVIAKPLDVDGFPKTLNRILSGEEVWYVK